MFKEVHRRCPDARAILLRLREARAYRVDGVAELKTALAIGLAQLVDQRLKPIQDRMSDANVDGAGDPPTAVLLYGRVDAIRIIIQEVAQRVQRALDDGTPADPRELLGPAEAPSGAGGEDDAADGQRASSISAASASSDAIELPGSRWSTCGSAARMPRVNGS